jgi:hypothetical protein
MRPRFSLKTFLIAVVLTGAACGGVAAWRQSIVDQADRHASAMQALDLRTANPVIRDQDKYPAYVNFVRTWIHPRAFEMRDRICAPHDYWTPEHIAALKNLNGLEDVTCFFDRLTVEDAHCLAAIPELRQLSVSFKEFEPGALAAIASIQTLESLSTHDVVDDAFFEALRAHPKLTALSLDESPLSMKHAQILATIPQLEELEIRGAKSDPQALPILANTKITTLTIAMERCAPEALKSLKQSQLKSLFLSCPQFEKGTIKAIAGARHLQRLQLDGSIDIEPGELAALSNCTALNGLQLKSVRLNSEQFGALTSHPTLMTIRAREAEGAKEAIRRFRDSKPGREFESL